MASMSIIKVANVGFGAKTLEKRTTPVFRAKLARVAQDIGADPSDLAAVIGLETMYTFDPAIRNQHCERVLCKGDRACVSRRCGTGLIQFMPSTAKRLGVTTDQLAAMSGVEQLDYVRRYFLWFGRGFSNVDQLYYSVFWPACRGKSAGHVVAEAGSNVYSQNRGFDRAGRGYFTCGDVSGAARQARATGRTYLDVDTSLAPTTFGWGDAVGLMAFGAASALAYRMFIEPRL